MNEGSKFRFDLWLYNEMKKRNWNCLDMAVESGTSEKSIYEYVHGKQLPTLKNLAKILEGLGMHMEFVED